MIKVSQLLKTVPTADGDLTILHGVDLEIVAGTSAAIVGASGSGKSTLLGLLAGMDVASAGEVWPVSRSSRRDASATAPKAV